MDSGLVRRLRFDPATGMSRLETERISRASAEQRQGRAGRVEPGVCYRAWSEGAQRSLAPFSPAEIVEADLTPLALEIAGWGVRDAAALRWLDPPPVAMLASARDLLERLGALDTGGRITPHGREMTRLGVHPRLAHMLLRAKRTAPWRSPPISRRCCRSGISCAARRQPGMPTFAGESRLCGGRAGPVEWIARRCIEPGAAHATCCGSSARLPTRIAWDAPSGGSAGGLLALAFPDRIGRRRAWRRGALHAHQRARGAFRRAEGLSRQELIVAVDLDDRERDARIRLAAPVPRADIEEHMASRLVRADSVEWNAREQAVLARRVLRLDSLVLEESALPEVPREEARAAMLEGIRQLGVESLPWSRGDARPAGAPRLRTTPGR